MFKKWLHISSNCAKKFLEDTYSSFSNALEKRKYNKVQTAQKSTNIKLNYQDSIPGFALPNIKKTNKTNSSSVQRKMTKLNELNANVMLLEKCLACSSKFNTNCNFCLFGKYIDNNLTELWDEVSSGHDKRTNEHPNTSDTHLTFAENTQSSNIITKHFNSSNTNAKTTLAQYEAIASNYYHSVLAKKHLKSKNPKLNLNTKRSSLMKILNQVKRSRKTDRRKNLIISNSIVNKRAETDQLYDLQFCNSTIASSNDDITLNVNQRLHKAEYNLNNAIREIKFVKCNLP